MAINIKRSEMVFRGKMQIYSVDSTEGNDAIKTLRKYVETQFQRKFAFTIFSKFGFVFGFIFEIEFFCHFFQRKQHSRGICFFFFAIRQKWKSRWTVLCVFIFYLFILFAKTFSFLGTAANMHSNKRTGRRLFTILPSFESCIYGKEAKNLDFFFRSNQNFSINTKRFSVRIEKNIAHTLWPTKDEKLNIDNAIHCQTKMHWRLLTSFLFNNANARRSPFFFHFHWMKEKRWVKVPTRKW